MNRRRFLQLSIALAACAPIAHLRPDDIGKVAPDVPVVPGWEPTQADVNEWLVYYKIAVRQGVERFHTVMAKNFVTDTPEETAEELDLYKQAEAAFDALEADRGNVAWSQGAGYAAGRDGHPRENPRYTAASNEAFGWYNGWAVGHQDRLRKIRAV